MESYQVNIKRILTVESVDDRSTRKMLESIYGASEFKDYIIDHDFIAQAKDSSELLELLDLKIRNFNPDCILLHTGMAFYRMQALFMDVIPKLRNSFPRLLVGIQNRANMKAEFLAILDSSKEIFKLEEKIFRLNR